MLPACFGGDAACYFFLLNACLHQLVRSVLPCALLTESCFLGLSNTNEVLLLHPYAEEPVPELTSH